MRRRVGNPSNPDRLRTMNHQHTPGLRGARLLAELDTASDVDLPDEINLDGCRLEALPERLGRIAGLKTLSLYDNDLSALPEWIWGLRSLSTLNLASNRLSSIPERIGNLTGLQMLDLGHNDLASLPEATGDLGDLEFLYA